MTGTFEQQRRSDSLCVMLGLGAIVCAVPSSEVGRLLLVDEARLRRNGVLEVEGGKFAAWDLARLLGFKHPAPSSWVLLSVPHRGERVPIALRAGQCLEVAQIDSSQKLPSSMFRERRGAFVRAFNPGPRQRAAGGVVGLLLDPLALLTELELQSSITRLAAA